MKLFDKYGRMNANLGYEITDPTTIPSTSNGVGFTYIDPPNEIFTRPGETQIWKITHNGVDTHAIHFHLVNVQLINRVGWDGADQTARPQRAGLEGNHPDEPVGSHLYRPEGRLCPRCPSGSPSVRPLNPSTAHRRSRRVSPTSTRLPGNRLMPLRSSTHITNFGREYVWHCHLLGHEENDMMRPLIMYRMALSGSLDNLLLTQ